MSQAKLLISVVAVAALAGGAYYYYPYYQQVLGKPAPDAVQATSQPAYTTLVFTSPPREPPEEGERLYQPIVEYLSRVTGKQIVYKHPSTWGLYRTEMLNGTYDIIFDGGHFADYRAQKLGYHIVAKMPQFQQFAIIVRKGDGVKTPAELVGQTVCSPPAPNQGALHLLSQYDDPARQPVTVPITSTFWASVYKGVVEGRCRGGVLVLANLLKYDKNGAIKIVHKTPRQPNQAWSVSPRVSPEDRAKIAAALSAPEAAEPTAALRERFKVGESFIAADNAEYAGLGDLLRHEWGFF